MAARNSRARPSFAQARRQSVTDPRATRARWCGSGAICAISTTRRSIHALKARAARPLRIRLRSRNPRRAAAARTTGASNSSGSRVVELAASLGVARRRADRPARRRARRDPAAGRRTGRSGGLRQPRLRARGAAIAMRTSPTTWPPVGIAFRTVQGSRRSSSATKCCRRPGTPFSVFTPYKNAWLQALTPFHVKAYPVDAYAGALARRLQGIATGSAVARGNGISCAPILRHWACPRHGGRGALFADFRKRIDRYREARDFPARKGPSYLSVHLRFGTVSIRELAAFAHRARDASPRGRRGDVAVGTHLARLLCADSVASPARDRPPRSSRNTPTCRFPATAEHFAAWCEGRTGYPIVDAAMRQLNPTGYMHNRLRMIAASFLVKDLLVDWRLGENIFRRHADRLRPRVEQRRLAVGGVDRLRRAALLPHLQSRHAVGEIRRRRARSSGATCPELAAPRRARNSRAVAIVPASCDPAEKGDGDRPRLPGADRRPRRDERALPLALDGCRSARIRRLPTHRTPLQSSSCRRCFAYSVASCCCNIGGAGLVVRQRHRPRALPARHRL